MATDLAAAKTYIAANCLSAAGWAAATDATRQIALNQAESEILSLPWRYETPEQNRLNAIYEQAAFSLDVSQFRANLQAQGVVSASISGGASETYKPTRYGFPLAPGVQKWTRGWVSTSCPTR